MPGCNALLNMIYSWGPEKNKGHHFAPVLNVRAREFKNLLLKEDEMCILILLFIADSKNAICEFFGKMRLLWATQIALPIDTRFTKILEQEPKRNISPY